MVQDETLAFSGMQLMAADIGIVSAVLATGVSAPRLAASYI